MIKELYEKHKSNREAIKVLNYLQDLSASSGIKLDGIDLNQFLVPNQQDGKYLTYREINKIFFAIRPIDKPKDDNTPVVLNATEITILKDLDLRVKTTHERRVTDGIRNSIENIQSYQQSIDREFQILTELRKRQIEGFDAVGFVNTVCQNPFYSFFECAYMSSRIYIRFLTRPISLRVKAAEQPLLLGQFVVEVLPEGPSIYVKKASDFTKYRNMPNKIHNIVSGGHWHPFIGGGGGICWGSASEVAGDLISRGEWSKVMALLESLLTTYPGGQPYMGMDGFWSRGIRDDGTAEWRVQEPPEQGELDVEDEEPELQYCDWCDVEYNPEDESHGDGECYHVCDHCEAQISIDDHCSRCEECEECGEMYNTDDEDEVAEHRHEPRERDHEPEDNPRIVREEPTTNESEPSSSDITF